MAEPSKRTFKSKLLVITVSILLLMSVATLSAVAWTNSATENERLADIENQIRQSIHSRGATLSESHAIALKNLVSDNAFSDVMNLVARATGQEDVVYGAFVSAEGQGWAYVSPTSRADSRPQPDAWKELGLPENFLTNQQQSRRKVHLFDEDIEEFSAPVVGEESELLGTVVYGLSTRRMSQAVEAARQKSREELSEALMTIGLLGLGPAHP